MSKKKNDRHVLQNYIIPTRDRHGQWWLGYQKVRMIRHPEWAKDLSHLNKGKEDGC